MLKKNGRNRMNRFSRECVMALYVLVQPGINEHWEKVTAEDLLSQEINQCREHPELPNYFYMLTEYVQEHQQDQDTIEMATRLEQSM